MRILKIIPDNHNHEKKSLLILHSTIQNDFYIFHVNFENYKFQFLTFILTIKIPE